jgi:hypothetical protein
MGNEYGAADLQPHLGYGLTVHHLLDWDDGTAEVSTILAGGYHQKMRLRHAYVQVMGYALHTTEPIINIRHGANEVVATIDMATALSAQATIGEMAELTIVDAYKDLEADDALQIELETQDGGSSTGTLGFFTFEYELVE